MDIDESQYFERCISLLSKHKWIYDFKVTEFFTEKVWNGCPLEWLEFLKTLPMSSVHKLPTGDAIENLPESLSEFLNSCLELTRLKEERDSKLPLKFNLSKNETKTFSEKKQQEIENFAPVILDFCQKTNTRSILDIGCGLGHLANILYQRLPNCKIIGLDSDSTLCNRAFEKNAHCPHFMSSPGNSNGVTFCNFSLKNNHESAKLFYRLVDSLEKPVALVCLHGCADLQPTLMKILAKMPKTHISGLLTIGCCYHKMSFLENQFPAEFPMSKTASEAIKNVSSDFRLSKFALRLAAQETVSRWKIQTPEHHKAHTDNVAFRGIFALLESQGFNFGKTKRREFRHNDAKSFETFVQSVMRRTGHDIPSQQQYAQVLMQLYNDYLPYFSLIEPITALQVALQGPLESLILMDRLVFLRENGLQADLIPVFDSVVSPRNMLIFSYS